MVEMIAEAVLADFRHRYPSLAFSISADRTFISGSSNTCMGLNITFLDNEVDISENKFIRIYNLLGQLVAVIDISHLGSGVHTIKFDGRDNWGNDLGSGIYFCQLVIGRKVQSTFRISLVK